MTLKALHHKRKILGDKESTLRGRGYGALKIKEDKLKDEVIFSDINTHFLVYRRQYFKSISDLEQTCSRSL